MSVPITIENLNLWYHKHQMLRNINAVLPPKSVTVIIGPSGCGKTTTLRCLNRMIDLVPGARVQGRVLFGDKDIYGPGVDVTGIRQRAVLILQKPTPLPMSIFENVAYGPHLFGQRRKALHETVERCLRTVGLWEEVKDRLKESAVRLSIGQQQRLCLARGLAVEPEVLLFDEPTSSLDPDSTKMIEEEILRLKEEYTCVVVTHNMRQSKRLADYVMFMRNGEITAFDVAEKIFNSEYFAASSAYI